MSIPAPLRAEHPDDDLWDSLKVAFREAMARFESEAGGSPDQIVAMGLCTIRCCRVLLKADGTLAYPVINWMDERLNVPYVYDEAYGDVSLVTTTSGYITRRLTGECKDTCANYIGHWPMDDDTGDWSTDPEAFKRCNTPRKMLFDVVRPGDILGYVTAEAAKATGVPEGMPVVATAHDKAVETLGSGSLGRGTALVSLGTYIGVMVHGDKRRKDAKSFWSFPASIPGRFLYECMGVRLGMWTISWFCEQFGAGIIDEAKRRGLSVEEFFNQEAEVVPAGAEGLITIHDWAPPPEAMYRKGVMLGFDGRHGRGHMYRSLLEGIALTLKNHTDKMMAELNTTLLRLVISGGGSDSDVFMQILADVFGVPACRNQMNGSAAVGCAINAGMAVALFRSYDAAIEKMIRVGKSVLPMAANTHVYEQLNERVYKHASSFLDPLLMRHNPLLAVVGDNGGQDTT